MMPGFDNGPFASASSKPFGEVVDERDRRFDNQPPLQERVMLEFEEDLERAGVAARAQELLEAAATFPAKIEDEDAAGKAGDLCKMARALEQKIEDIREKHNRPLIDARSSLKAKADGIFEPLGQAIAAIRQTLNAYAQQKAREAEAERQRLAEEERKAREALREAQVSEEVIACTVQAPEPARKPIARGSYGSAVSGTTVYKHERLVPIAKLPKHILENAKVVEAVDAVIAQMVKTGTREIKGVRIFPTTQARVR